MAKTPQKYIDAIRILDDANYFKTLVRFPADTETEIRAAAEASKRTLNNFIVAAACKAAGIPEPVLKEAGRKRGSKNRKEENHEKKP